MLVSKLIRYLAIFGSYESPHTKMSSTNLDEISNEHKI